MKLFFRSFHQRTDLEIGTAVSNTLHCRKEWAKRIGGLLLPLIAVLFAVLKLTGATRLGWEWIVIGPFVVCWLFLFLSLIVSVGQAFLELTDVIKPNIEVNVQEQLRCWIQGKTVRDRIELAGDEICRKEESIRKDLIERHQSENKMSLKVFVVVTAVLGVWCVLENGPPWFRHTCVTLFLLILFLIGEGGLLRHLSSHAKGSKFHYKRGHTCLFNKENDQAIVAFTEAIRLSPKYAAAFYDRGNAWTAKKEYDKAIADFSEALRLEPKSDAAYCNRGNAWWFKHQSARALADYLEAIRLDPNQAVYYRNGALVLATCPETNLRDGNRAILLATKACELTNWTGAWEMAALAAGYAESGQFDEAEHCQIRSFDVPNSSDEDRAEFRKRLELYKRKLPYRVAVVNERVWETVEAAHQASVDSEREASGRRAMEEHVRQEQAALHAGSKGTEASQEIDTSPALSRKRLKRVVIEIVRECREQHALRTGELRQLVVETFTEKFSLQPTDQHIEAIEAEVIRRLRASLHDGWILPRPRTRTPDPSKGDWLDNFDFDSLGNRDNWTRAMEGD
jgi:tetratricopeptide (TPR) repeat protein